MAKKKLKKLITILEKNIKTEEQFRSEELHKVALTSFIENSGELDKRLVSLSVGSLGFLLAFLINEYSYKSDFFNGATFGAFLIAVVGFSFTIYLLLEILKLNNEYYKLIIAFPIEDKTNISKKAKQLDLLEKKMKKYDICTKRIFITSIAISAFFIIMITINKNIIEYTDNNTTKENKVIEKNIEETVQELIKSGATLNTESASGLYTASKSVNSDTQKSKNESAEGLFKASQKTKSNPNQSKEKGN